MLTQYFLLLSCSSTQQIPSELLTHISPILFLFYLFFSEMMMVMMVYRFYKAILGFKEMGNSFDTPLFFMHRLYLCMVLNWNYTHLISFSSYFGISNTLISACYFYDLIPFMPYACDLVHFYFCSIFIKTVICLHFLPSHLFH